VVTHKGRTRCWERPISASTAAGFHTADIVCANEPAFEQYLNSPRDTKPEDLLTLIHVPLGA